MESDNENGKDKAIPPFEAEISDKKIEETPIPPSSPKMDKLPPIHSKRPLAPLLRPLPRPAPTATNDPISNISNTGKHKKLSSAVHPMQAGGPDESVPTSPIYAASPTAAEDAPLIPKTKSVSKSRKVGVADSNSSSPVASVIKKASKKSDASDSIEKPKEDGSDDKTKKSADTVSNWKRYIKGGSEDPKVIARLLSHGAGKPDLLNLAVAEYTESAISQNLRERFVKDQIYTRIGVRCLVSINPLKEVPADKQAFHGYDLDSISVKTSEEISPHIYELAATAHLHMLKEKEDQTIVALYEHSYT